MRNNMLKIFGVLVLAISFGGFLFYGINRAADVSVKTAAKNTDSVSSTLPTPADGKDNLQTAVFSGGCFWGVEAVFEHVKGVKDVTSGYSGGAKETADYETVSEGASGHAESVKVVFDPAQVSYAQLLKVFFAVAHDPTELNRQGPDTGTQYRSAIFYAGDEQKKIAADYIAELTKAKAFPRPIVTEIALLKSFYAAEDYHQNYLARHPNQPYIVVNDQPKVENLSKQFPDLFVTK